MPKKLNVISLYCTSVNLDLSQDDVYAMQMQQQNDMQLTLISLNFYVVLNINKITKNRRDITQKITGGGSGALLPTLKVALLVK